MQGGEFWMTFLSTSNYLSTYSKEHLALSLSNQFAMIPLAWISIMGKTMQCMFGILQWILHVLSWCLTTIARNCIKDLSPWHWSPSMLYPIKHLSFKRLVICVLTTFSHTYFNNLQCLIKLKQLWVETIRWSKNKGYQQV